MLGKLLNFFSGGIVKQFTDPLLEAHKAKLTAQTSEDKLEADMHIVAMEGARDIALAEAHDRWSAVRMGRWLIVVPFGLWWAALWLIQIINPWFGLSLVVVAVPPDVMAMAKVLIPAIVLGDAGTFIGRKRLR